MQEILEKSDKIREVIAQGSTMCPREDIPMLVFLSGFMYSQIPNMSDLFSFLEVLYFLKAEKKIKEMEFAHILLLLNEKPKLYEEIANLLDQISEKQGIQILLQLDKINEGSKSVSKSKKKEPIGEKQNGSRQTLTRQNANKTVELPDNTIQMDGNSEITEKYDEEYFNKIEQVNKESEALAKMLQEEEEKMARINNKDEEILCEICYVGLYDQAFIPLESCEHIFHKNCLMECFKSLITENKFPLKCPNDQCGIDIKDSDIKQVLEKQIYQKYEKHTLKFYADLNGDSISWCPTADCEYMFFFEKDDDVRFECPECQKEYCLNCRADWHKDMSCKEYQITNTHSSADDLFMKFVKGKKFKQCPRCKFWVEKNQGCDHMTCKCKFQFCYKCGGVYGKCECTKKFQEEMERRREQQAARAEKKKQRLEKLKKKQEKEPPARRNNRRNRQ